MTAGLTEPGCSHNGQHPLPLRAGGEEDPVLALAEEATAEEGARRGERVRRKVGQGTKAGGIATDRLDGADRQVGRGTRVVALWGGSRSSGEATREAGTKAAAGAADHQDLVVRGITTTLSSMVGGLGTEVTCSMASKAPLAGNVRACRQEPRARPLKKGKGC